MKEDEIINLIKDRIENEYCKHPYLDWPSLAAIKLYKIWEDFSKQTESLRKELQQEVECVDHIKEVCDNYEKDLNEELAKSAKLVEAFEAMNQWLCNKVPVKFVNIHPAKNIIRNALAEYEGK